MVELSILIGIIVGAGISTLFLKMAEDAETIIGAISGIIGGVLAFAIAVAFVAYFIKIWDWHASEYKTSIINREYKTNYSREEIFYAKDVINIIRELDRKRIEINGSILKEIR